MRILLSAVIMTLTLSGAALAQGLFGPAIKVNDRVITGYELEQRERMVRLFRAPGNPAELARTQLIEERLKEDAAAQMGLRLSPEQVEAGMEEFAARANMTAEQFIRAIEAAGVSEQSYRDFVSNGVLWREVIRARFGNRVSVSETDIERAQSAVSGGSGVRVLLSEIIMPAPPPQAAAVQDRANQLSQITTVNEFAAAARRYSATPTRSRGGRLDWMPITQLPPQLRPIILGLAPGEVTDPLPLEGAVALFQLRAIEEVPAPTPEPAAIEYAAYYIAGGRTEAALTEARRVKARVDVCDDLYGIAQGQPPEVLERGAKAPADIPQDIAIELAKLDPGEVSTTLTRANGQTLVFLMLCGRTPVLAEDGPTVEDFALQIRNQRLASFANGYLAQLKAEARIVER